MSIKKDLNLFKQQRAIIVGFGAMAKVYYRYLVEKGMTVIAAFNRSTYVGEDAGEVSGMGKTGLIIQKASEAEKLFPTLNATICFISTTSILKDNVPMIELAVGCGLNTAVLCEEAFYPQGTDKALYDRLDQLAKDKGVSILGSGYQDIYWGNLAATLASATHNLTKIEGWTSYDAKDYGISLAHVHGVGLTPEEFKAKITDGPFVPSYVYVSAQWLCDRLRLTKKSLKQEGKPTFASKPVSVHGIDCPSGVASGLEVTVTLETEEGVTIVVHQTGKIYEEGEKDRNDWILTGDPSIDVSIKVPETVGITCGSYVNRIVQLINGPPGYINTAQMPVAKYLGKP